MGRQEMREKVASELFATAVREEHLLRVDRGPAGRGEHVEFKDKVVEAIAEACVHAADNLIRALDRQPEG
jgi:hypothetical protein